MDMDNKVLKIYRFDRVSPMAYIEMVLGLLMSVGACFWLYYVVTHDEGKSGLSNAGIGLMFLTIALFWIGLFFIIHGISISNMCEKGFLAERDGHIYTFNINPKRIQENKVLPVGTIGKLANSLVSIENANFYQKKIDELIKSPEFYDEINKMLDDEYSYLFAIRDLASNKYNKIEKWIYLTEYKRVSTKE